MNRITFTQYYAGTAVYCGVRKAIQLRDARVDVYNEKKHEYKKVPMLLVDKIGLIGMASTISPYMFPLACIRDLKTLEVRMCGLDKSDFFHDNEDNVFWHLFC
jgi:hypothetical protein